MLTASVFLNKPRLLFKSLKSTSSSNHKVRGSHGKKKEKKIEKKSARHQFSVQKTSIKCTNYLSEEGRRNEKLPDQNTEWQIQREAIRSLMEKKYLYLHFIFALKCSCFNKIITDISTGKPCSISLKAFKTVQLIPDLGRGQRTAGAAVTAL